LTIIIRYFIYLFNSQSRRDRKALSRSRQHIAFKATI
jgi:hypothetical protein